MTQIGFSTGALKLGDFRASLRLLRETTMDGVELSALRLQELPGLIASLQELDLTQFAYIALHAPSSFSSFEEDGVIDLLKKLPRNWPIIIHPDTIHDYKKWLGFGSQLAIENMDRRKIDGRTAEELAIWFNKIPSARLCFDMAHAHQCDRTMTEGFRILVQHKGRLCQVHLSELDSVGHHYPLSLGSIQAFSEIASLIPSTVPIIIESLNPLQDQSDQDQRAWIALEAKRALEALARSRATSVGKPLEDATALSPSGVAV
jgi:sugar phosphate isomerase/epimerase